MDSGAEVSAYRIEFVLDVDPDALENDQSNLAKGSKFCGEVQ